MRCAIITAFVAALLTGGQALAQAFDNQYRYPRPVTEHRYVYANHGHPHYGHHGYHHSTAAGSYYHGLSAYLRGLGEYQKDRAEAAKGWLEAYDMYLEARSNYVRAYFERQKLNRDYREAELKPPSQEELNRLSEIGVPVRIDPNELDVRTGEIAWPRPLQGKEFADERADLESLFAERARAGVSEGVGSDIYAEVHELTGQMRDALKENIDQMRPMTYIDAKNFLESLAYESRFRVPDARLAGE